MRFSSHWLTRSLMGVAALGLAACSTDDTDTAQAPPAGINSSTARYIVTFKPGVLPAPTKGGATQSRTAANRGSLASSIRREYADAQSLRTRQVSSVLAELRTRAPIAVERTFLNVLDGFVATLDAEQAGALRADSRVLSVEADAPVYLEQKRSGDPTVQAGGTQQTPYGITKVGGYVGSSTLSRWAFIIDSGIDLDHPDLNVNLQYDASFVSNPSADDQNGHGTHVAGTVAAKDNTIGVVGVAAGATVVPVRVFDASGSSANSIIIAGIDYVAQVALAGDVANMSLGGGASTSVDNAVKNLAAKGVHCALAAGNEARSATLVSPARTNGTRIWTVSAHDVNDVFARSFSNYGNPPVDVCGPGVSVYSTYLNGGYATLSGTSMATPHVAGILLVNNGTVRSRGTVKQDRDRTPDPLAAR